VHGTYKTLTCLGCYHQEKDTDQLLISFLEDSQIPSCSKCGGLLKPDLILYEEQLPMEEWNRAKGEILNCDLLLVLGSSLTVTPVCDLPYSALSAGAKLIIINNTHTHMDELAAVSIQGDLAELMPIIKDKVINEQE
jgi:NAD-dependent deacetylase